MDFLIDVAVYIFIVVNGIMIGWFAREKAAEIKVNKYLAHLNESNVATKENTLTLDVHIEHDQFYLYDKDNGKFITQVNTKDEMFAYFSKNYPNKNVIMTKEQLALFDTV